MLYLLPFLLQTFQITNISSKTLLSTEKAHDPNQILFDRLRDNKILIHSTEIDPKYTIDLISKLLWSSFLKSRIISASSISVGVYKAGNEPHLLFDVSDCLLLAGGPFDMGSGADNGIFGKKESYDPSISATYFQTFLNQKQIQPNAHRFFVADHSTLYTAFNKDIAVSPDFSRAESQEQMLHNTVPEYVYPNKTEKQRASSNEILIKCLKSGLKGIGFNLRTNAASITPEEYKTLIYPFKQLNIDVAYVWIDKFAKGAEAVKPIIVEQTLTAGHPGITI